MKKQMVSFLGIFAGRKILAVCAILLAMPLFAAPLWGKDGQSRLPVFASIDPQAYFLERIGGAYIDTEVLIGKGHSPHTYEPTPHEAAKLARARAFFGIGVPAEKTLLRKLKKTHPNLLFVETQKGVEYRYNADHRHDRQTGHGHGSKAPDPHIWLNPRLVKIQARNICEALSRLDPAHAREYASNLRAFEADLDRTDSRIVRLLGPLKGQKIYVFHPAFGYFTDAYGLVQAPIEIEGKEPSARQLAALISKAKRDRVKVIFVQPQFSAKSAETIAQSIGGVVVPIDPLARDYLSNLEHMAVMIERGAAAGR